MKKSSGFTLIELLVVMSIISLLSSVVMTSVSRARIKARDTARLTNLKQIQTALALYYSDSGVYPGINEWYKIETNAQCSYGSGYPQFRTIMPTTNIQSLPSDLGEFCGWYLPLNNFQGYYLLFDPEDNAIVNNDDPLCYGSNAYYCIGVNYP